MKSLSFAKPYMLVVVGIPGAGKSFFAKHFSDTFRAPFINFDKIRSDLYNNPTYSTEEFIILARVASTMLGEIIKTKNTVLIEGIGSTKAERTEIIKKAKKAGYEPLFIWVQTEPNAAKTRAVRGVKGQDPSSLIDDDTFERLSNRFTPLSKNEPGIVISGKHTYASQARIVLKRLAGNRTSPVKERATPNTRPAPRGHSIKVNRK